MIESKVKHLTSFLVEQDYSVFPSSYGPGLHIGRELFNTERFPRFHFHLPDDINSGMDLRNLTFRYDARGARVKVTQHIRSLTVAELARLRMILVNTSDIDLDFKEELLDRFSYLLLFDGVSHLNTVGVVGLSAVDRLFAKRNVREKHKKYRRQKDWRQEVE